MDEWVRAGRQLRKNASDETFRRAGGGAAFLQRARTQPSIPITRWIIHTNIYIHIFVNAMVNHIKFIRVFMSL